MTRSYPTSGTIPVADRFVVDTSVFLRWYIHGTDADALERAGELATRCTLRFFDAVLVDRALQRGMPLLTSDRKLANAVGTAAPVEILRGIP